MTPDGSLLASMRIQSTISPFFIDDNTHLTTYAPFFIMLLFYNTHQQLMLPFSSCFSSLSLWHQWQRIPICNASFIFSFHSPFYQNICLLFHSVNHILSPPVIMLFQLYLLLLSLKARGNASYCFHA